MLKIRESIIPALKGKASWVVKQNIKFGIQVPQIGNETQQKEWESSVEICDCKVDQCSYYCIQNT